MSEKGKTVGRRRLLTGILVLLGAAGGLIYEYPRLIGRRYPRTPYDDLLAQLGDRERAAKLGTAVIAARPDFGAQAAAQALRSGLGRGSIARAVSADIAQGRLSTVQGWLLPESLILVSGIAAKAQGSG